MTCRRSSHECLNKGHYAGDYRSKTKNGSDHGTDHSNASFSPPARMMEETEARHTLNLWKSNMTGGVYSLHVRRLCLGLLWARARTFKS
jgi:hypothetical protein